MTVSHDVTSVSILLGCPAPKYLSWLAFATECQPGTGMVFPTWSNQAESFGHRGIAWPWLSPTIIGLTQLPRYWIIYVLVEMQCLNKIPNKIQQWILIHQTATLQWTCCKASLSARIRVKGFTVCKCYIIKSFLSYELSTVLENNQPEINVWSLTIKSLWYNMVQRWISTPVPPSP